MSSPDETVKYRYLAFRRPSWPWAAVGMVLVMAAAAYTGSDWSQLALERVGRHVLVASFFALGGGGALCLLVAASIFMEYVGVDEAAIEQIRMGRREVRILWKDVERIVLHKSKKRPKGAVEVRGPHGRSIVAEPRLAQFDRLEEAILERAGFFGIEVKSYR